MSQMSNQENTWPYWICLVAVAIASWAAYFWLTRVPGYADILIAFAISHILLGAWMIKLTRCKWQPLLIIGVVVFIGQFWILFWSVTFLIWSVTGFAP